MNILGLLPLFISCQLLLAGEGQIRRPKKILFLEKSQLYKNATWSPKGDYLLVVGKKDLKKYHFQTKTWRQYPYANVIEARFSHNGKKCALLHHKNENWSISIMDIDTGECDSTILFKEEKDRCITDCEFMKDNDEILMLVKHRYDLSSVYFEHWSIPRKMKVWSSADDALRTVEDAANDGHFFAVIDQEFKARIYHPRSRMSIRLYEDSIAVRANNKALCDLSFSPDGVFFVTHNNFGIVSVWEESTGIPFCRIDVTSKRLRSLKEDQLKDREYKTARSMSRFGEDIYIECATSCRMIAVYDHHTNKWQENYSGKLVRIWDILTGKEAVQISVIKPVCRLRFSPDGRLLLVVQGDGEINVWDVGNAVSLNRETKSVETPRLRKFVSDLGSKDPKVAIQAMLKLGQGCSNVVELFDLKAESDLELSRIRNDLKMLESRNYREREQANSRLQKVAVWCLPLLLDNYQNQTSLEAKLRLERIIRTAYEKPDPKYVRAVRMLSVLENLSDEKSWQALEKLSNETPPNALAIMAREALERRRIRQGK